jgi:hypothetical protein
MTQDSNNIKNKDKKVNDKEKYTFDSSEDVKEIMTGRRGEGEGEGKPYPDSDKYIVEDIKKIINDKNNEEEE